MVGVALKPSVYNRLAREAFAGSGLVGPVGTRRSARRNWVRGGSRWCLFGVLNDPRPEEGGEVLAGMQMLLPDNFFIGFTQSVPGPPRRVPGLRSLLSEDPLVAVQHLRMAAGLVATDELDALTRVAERRVADGVSAQGWTAYEQGVAWLVLGDLGRAHEFLSENCADRCELLGRSAKRRSPDDAIFGEIERTEALDALVVAGDRRGAMELLDAYAEEAAVQVGYQRGDRDEDPWWPR